MKKISIGAILRGLQQLANPEFLFASAMVTWYALYLGAQLVLALFLPGVPRGNFATALGHGLLGALTGLLLIPVIINAHRFLLLGEKPNTTSKSLSLNYFLAALGLYLPVAAIMLLNVVANWLLRGVFPGFFVGILTLVAVVAALYIGIMYLLPMSLVLPARALGRADYTYGDAYTAGKNNIGRLLLVTLALALIILLVMIPVGIAIGVFQALTGAIGLSVLGSLGVAFLFGVVNIASAMVGAGILSLAYAALVEDDERYLDDPAV